MSWLELGITAGGYIVSGIVYWVTSKSTIFTQEKIKEMREGIDALSQGLKSIKKEKKQQVMRVETKIKLNKFQPRHYQVPIFDAIENKGYKRVLAMLPRS